MGNQQIAFVKQIALPLDFYIHIGILILSKDSSLSLPLFSLLTPLHNRGGVNICSKKALPEESFSDY